MPLRSQLRRQRARFRIGHELGHTFFYWRDREEPERHLIDSPAQERFCDAFARALLVPPQVASERPPTCATILDLQREFDVSLEVAARSVASGHPRAEVALWHWAVGARPQQQWANHSCGAEVAPDALRLAERRQALVCRLPV